jgi:hypothetical protein
VPPDGVEDAPAFVERPPYPSKGGGDSLIRIVGYLIENGWVTFPEGDTSSLETLAKNAEKFNAFYPLGNLW